MGYEGHLMLAPDRADRAKRTAEAMALLARAHADVGGEVVSAGGTGTFDLNAVATEIQAGSYALMDTAYAKLELPFRPALSLLATVISVSPRYAVADCGLKALGMDHGNPAIDGREGVVLLRRARDLRGGDGTPPGRARARVARPRRPDRRVPRAASTSCRATTSSTPGRSTCAAGRRRAARRVAPGGLGSGRASG